ncbi:hypothetical protein GM708_14495 [Vibrio cholerae]|jgi:uncharacterized membrane protein YdbT with pleckstrin-like domain|nr:hypothetical protein [Vibrio cholerae]
MSHEASAESQPAHAGKGHLVSNIVWFVVIFGAFLLSMYSLTWFTPQEIWPMGVLVVVAFLVFYIPQGILGRADTGYNLAEGNRTDEKEKGTAVSS